MTELGFWARDGKFLPLSVWRWLFTQETYRQVARNVVTSTVHADQGLGVSTAWRGFDPNVPLWSPGPGRPDKGMIFETAVIEGDSWDTARVIESWPAATEAGARRAHDRAVQWACGRLTAPTIHRLPVVPAHPRDGW